MFQFIASALAILAFWGAAILVVAAVLWVSRTRPRKRPLRFAGRDRSIVQIIR